MCAWHCVGSRPDTLPVVSFGAAKCSCLQQPPARETPLHLRRSTQRVTGGLRWKGGLLAATAFEVSRREIHVQ